MSDAVPALLWCSMIALRMRQAVLLVHNSGNPGHTVTPAQVSASKMYPRRPRKKLPLIIFLPGGGHVCVCWLRV